MTLTTSRTPLIGDFPTYSVFALLVTITIRFWSSKVYPINFLVTKYYPMNSNEKTNSWELDHYAIWKKLDRRCVVYIANHFWYDNLKRSYITFIIFIFLYNQNHTFIHPVHNSTESINLLLAIFIIWILY